MTYLVINDTLETEYKTKFILEGKIDNTSFNKLNSFSYHCYLEVHNYFYDGDKYIEDYSSPFIKKEAKKITEDLMSVFFKKTNMAKK